MGIRGARSLMDADPARYTEVFTWNWEPHDITETLGVLIDAKSLLYHLIMGHDGSQYASPATVHDLCSGYVHQLIAALIPTGGVHFFFDGLAPVEKIESQIERMERQAMNGDRLARGEKSKSVKLLHPLGEAAFIEAVETHRLKHPAIVHLHRASMGEGEALIHHWISENPNAYSKIIVISEDSDFLMYGSCPGFIPPSTLRFEEMNGKMCMQGQHYLRSKFLRSFMNFSEVGPLVMTTVAALAGCDYSIGKVESTALQIASRNIALSDLGGLRPKLRTNPTAAAKLIAILRVVAHYKLRYDGEEWMVHLCKKFMSKKPETLLAALHRVSSIYYQLPIVSSEMSINPETVEVRRLLRNAFVFCYPIVESFTSGDNESTRKTANDRKTSLDSGGLISPLYMLECVNVDIPPLKAHISLCTSRCSIYQLPHLQQARARLYAYVRFQISHGWLPAEISLHEHWKSQEPVVKEVSRKKSGKRSTVGVRRITVSEDEASPSKFLETALLLRSGKISVHQAIAFCVCGESRPCPGLKEEHIVRFGAPLVASLMLPFDLACLFLLMSTAPRDMPTLSRLPTGYRLENYTELNEALSLLTVVTVHANLLLCAINTLSPENRTNTSLPVREYPGINVSSTFRHDVAAFIWSSIHDGRCIGYLKCEDSFQLTAFTDHILATMVELCPSDNQWESSLQKWAFTFTSIYSVWWNIFMLRDHYAATSTSGCRAKT